MGISFFAPMLLVETKLGPSTIKGAGTGVFAARDLKKGEMIWRYNEKFALLFDLKDAEPGSDLSEPARHLIRIWGYLDIYRNKLILYGDNSRFWNHSFSPNIGSHPDEKNSLDYIYALRDIKAGEELFEDYSTWNDPYWDKTVAQFK